MRALSPNVVQAEFFHVGKNKRGSLEELMAECFSRVGDGLADLKAGADPRTVGTGIKTCVRFYDTDYSMTSLVARERKLTERLDLAERVSSARGLRKIFLRWRYKRLVQEIASTDQARLLLVRQALKADVQYKRPIALEVMDSRGKRCFRFLRKDEAHELLEAVTTSTHVWVFLFKPKDLLAEENEGIGHSM